MFLQKDVKPIFKAEQAPQCVMAQGSLARKYLPVYDQTALAKH